MALAKAVQGGKRPSQSITWYDEDGDAFDLTNATITAKIERVGEWSASDGTFTPDADQTTNTGVFVWQYGTADVAIAGRHRVQFNAAFSSGITPAKTFITNWIVGPSAD